MDLKEKLNEQTNNMKPLVIEPTPESLGVSLKSGKLEFSGRSIPEDPMKLFAPILEWIEEYIKNPPDSTSVNLNFEYINTSSSKHILNILEVLNRGYDKNTDNMKITWSYEIGDDDMYELGKFIESMIDIPMDYIEVEESVEY
jgi:hypothetical protein